MEKLERQYGSTGQSSMYRAELESRRRRKGESLVSLQQDIARLMVLAYPGARTKHFDAFAVDSFIKSLDDSGLRLKIRELEPRDLDDAVKHAKRLEAYQVTARKEDNYSTVPSTNRARSVNQQNDPYIVPAVRREEHPSQNDREMANELRRLRSENEALKERFAALERQSTGRTYNQPNDVTTNDQTVRRPSQQPTGGNSVSCYGCHQPGHIRRNCPRNDRGTGTFNRTYKSFGPSQRRYRESTSHRMNHTSPERRTSESRPRRVFLDVQIHGQNVPFLLDTGCEKTLVRSSMVTGMRLRRTPFRLFAANGTPIHVRGAVTIPIVIGGERFDSEALVVDEATDNTIGIDWLEHHNVMWALGNGTVEIRGRRYTLRAGGEESLCRRVITSESVTIAPGTEVVIESRLSRRKGEALLESQDWVTETLPQTDRLLVARAVLPRRCDQLPLRVLNCLAEAIFIPKDSELAKAVPVEVEQLSNTSSAMDYSHVDGLIEGHADCVTLVEKERLRSILHEYVDVFSVDEFDMGYTNIAMHEINTGEACPYKATVTETPDISTTRD